MRDEELERLVQQGYTASAPDEHLQPQPPTPSLRDTQIAYKQPRARRTLLWTTACALAASSAYNYYETNKLRETMAIYQTAEQTLAETTARLLETYPATLWRELTVQEEQYRLLARKILELRDQARAGAP